MSGAGASSPTSRGGPLLPAHAPLTLRGRPRIAGARSGAHRSKIRGRGLVFEEVRPYLLGDDPRLLDGNVTARTGDPHVKVFAEERERPVHVIVDLGPETLAGFPEAPLARAAATAAALLGQAAFGDGDRVTLHLLREGPSAPRRFPKLPRLLEALEHALATPLGPPPAVAVPAVRSVRERLRALVAALRELLPGPPPAPTGLSLHAHLTRALGAVRRGEAVYVISPFFGPFPELPLSALARRGEVLAIPILAAAERLLPRPEVQVVTDVRTGASVVVDGADRRLRARALDREERRQESVRQGLRQLGIPTLVVDAGEGPVPPFERAFRRGR